MNLRKLSIAAALSIGVMTIGCVASADQIGGAAPCPPKRMEMPCPMPCPAEPCPTGQACPVPQTILIPQVQCPQEVYSPICPSAPAGCPTGAAVTGCPITECLPNCAPNAKVIKRQAFAYPDIGSAGFVFPNDNRLVQIGGEAEPLAISSTCGVACAGGGMAGVTDYCGALALIPESQQGIPFPFTGAAANCGCDPCQAACMDYFTQGLEIHRCGIQRAPRAGSTAISDNWINGGRSSYYGYGYGQMGAASQLNPYCGSCGGACPISPCDSCNSCNPYVPSVPLGGACPINPSGPCNTCAPLTVAPLGAACPCSPCNCDPCNCNPCAAPMGYPTAVNACDSCAAAGIPRSIQTSSGIQFQQTVLAPVEVPVEIGAAAPCVGPCPVSPQFPDVTNNLVSGCDINKLAAKGILAGYPDRSFKPNLPIMRDEFASALISAAELKNVPDFPQQIFKDVPTGHWANSDIDKAYNRGLVSGYPDSTFKPDHTVSRAEAMSAMAKVIPGELSMADSQQAISCYPDANLIPAWAVPGIAEAINAGLIANLPDNCLRPNDSASRGEVASMLGSLRIALGLDAQAVTTGAATQLQPQVVTSTVPTLKLRFEDIISARTSEVGDRFLAKTTEPVTIDGRLYPVDSEVRGQVAEVIRPMLGKSGAIRVDFHTISCDDGGGELTLPKEVLSAMVVKEDTPNIIGRLFAFPFTLPGKVAGIAGRTAGGTVIVASNMVEGFLNNIGNGNNELLNLEAAAAGRSYLMSGQDLLVGVWDVGRTAVSGTFGIFKESADEVVYLVAADGHRIAQINPDEILSVAFGCTCNTANACGSECGACGAAAPACGCQY